MAIIKFTNSKAELKTIIGYVTRTDKTKANLIIGKDCIANSCLEEMKTVKEFYNKNDGRQYIHIVQLFSPKDDLDYQKVHEIGIKLANYFKGFQVLVATHTDREHIHNHLIINSVNFKNGKKFNQSKNDVQKVKDYSDKLCKEAGLEIIEKKKYQGIYNKNEYQVALKGQSWKMKLANAIDYSLERSKNKTEFFKNMNKLGYQVLWTKKRKYITYTIPEGMKCRDNKLNDKKYLKEEMENAINGRIKEEKSNRYTRRTRANTNTNNNEIHVIRSRYSNRNDNLEQTIYRRYKRNKDNFEKGETRNAEHYERFTRKIDRECRKNYYRQDERIYTPRREIQREKYCFQNKDNFYSNNYMAYSRLDNNSITLIAIDILANMARPNNIKHPRKIKGWKKNLSKQAIKEWYLKNKNSSSFNWFEEEEEI